MQHICMYKTIHIYTYSTSCVIVIFNFNLIYTYFLKSTDFYISSSGYVRELAKVLLQFHDG